MPEPVGAGMPQAVTPPAGKDSPAPEPSISIDDLVTKVADSLMPRLSQEITGASKRHAASMREEVAGMLKGLTPPAPKDGDPEPKGKVNPLEVKVTDQANQIKALSDKAAKAEARARRSTVAGVVSGVVSADVADLLVDKYSALVEEDEAGALTVKTEEGRVAFGDFFKAEAAKHPGWLPPKGAAGTGAEPARGRTTTGGEAMPKSIREITHDPKTNKPYPDAPARIRAFQQTHTPEEFSAIARGGKVKGMVV